RLSQPARCALRLLLVGRSAGRALGEKVAARVRCGKRLERPRVLREVENVEHAVRARVGVTAADPQRRERRKTERLFHELQYAAELVLRMRDVAVPRVGRDYDARNAHSQTTKVELRRR